MRATLLLLFTAFTLATQAQVCDSLVPTYNIDFTGGNAGTTWTSPFTIRSGYCCSASGVNICVHFIAATDTNTEAIVLNICSYITNPGSMFYQIDCGSLI